MNNRREIFDFAMKQMSGFELEGSSHGDNRTIFSCIEALIRSVPGDTLEDCQKPLMAVLRLKARTKTEPFMGCKLILLQQTICTLFGGSKTLLGDKGFDGYDRGILLEYLETCRRMFITGFAITAGIKSVKGAEPKVESAMERALRLAMEGNGKKGGRSGQRRRK